MPDRRLFSADRWKACVQIGEEIPIIIDPGNEDGLPSTSLHFHDSEKAPYFDPVTTMHTHELGHCAKLARHSVDRALGHDGCP